MPEIQIPPHPTHDYFCGNCRYWLKDSAQNMAFVQTQGGVAMQPVAEMVKQGQSLAGLITGRVAPCTKFPKWESCVKQHWCHQFESEPNERVIKKGAGKFGAVEKAGELSSEPDPAENLAGFAASHRPLFE
jgi:hypothetical protein